MADYETDVNEPPNPSESNLEARDRGDRAAEVRSDNPAEGREPPKADAGTNRSKAEPAKSDDAQTGGDQSKKRRTRWPLIILGIVVLLAIVGGGIWWFLHRNQTDTDDAYTDGNIVIVAPQVDGQVMQLAVTDNQFVHKGDLLIQIDQRPYVAARDQAKGQLEAAQAQLDNAKLAVEKAKTTYPAQLASAQGQLAQAQSVLVNAQSDYKRQHAVNRSATTQQNVDQSQANLSSAQGQVQQAQAQVDIAKLIPENIAQAEAQEQQLEGQVQQQQAALDRAELNLSYARITAPQDGWVTQRNVVQGNYVQPGQQLMALVTPDIWVTANFKETQLDRMRPGQKVDFEVDAYPSLKLTGHVDSVQRGSGSKFSAFPAENATGNFVKIVQRVPVKLVIDSGLDQQHALPLGLSVVPTVYFQ